MRAWIRCIENESTHDWEWAPVHLRSYAHQPGKKVDRFCSMAFATSPVYGRAAVKKLMTTLYPRRKSEAYGKFICNKPMAWISNPTQVWNDSWSQHLITMIRCSSFCLSQIRSQPWKFIKTGSLGHWISGQSALLSKFCDPDLCNVQMMT